MRSVTSRFRFFAIWCSAVVAVSLGGSGVTRAGTKCACSAAAGAPTFPTNDDPAWSPDGRRIAFTTNRRDGSWDIYVMNANGKAQTPVLATAASEADPAWSPDGLRIAFTRVDEDDPHV